MSRACLRCGQTKPLAAFGRRSDAVDGIHQRCMDCVNASQRASWARKHPRGSDVEPGTKRCGKCGTKKELTAFGKDAHTEDAFTSQCRACRARISAESYVRHRRKRLVSHRQWQSANRERWRMLSRSGCARRRGRIYGTRTEAVDYERICRRDGMRCHICKRQVKKKDLHFDHVVPLAAGGEHVETNIAVSHAKCNTSKGSKVTSLF